MKAVAVKKIVIGEGRPKICVPIVAKTEAEILEEAKSFGEIPVDVVEWRVDWYEEAFGAGKEAVVDAPALEKICGTAKALQEILGEVPLLMTFRTLGEGGERSISLADYQALCVKTAENGCVDLVDVELFTSGEAMPAMCEAIHAAGVKIIASSHDFHKTPEKDEIVRRLLAMEQNGADISKIAVMPQSRRDVLTLLDATLTAQEQAGVPLITMSMAGTGTVSRLIGETFGSALTFGAAKKASAPGQIGVRDLETVLEIIHRAVG